VPNIYSVVKYTNGENPHTVMMIKNNQNYIKHWYPIANN